MKEVKVKVPTLNDLIPEEFKVHMMNATKEILLAFKSVVDYKLEKLGEIEKKLTENSKEVKKIDIE